MNEISYVNSIGFCAEYNVCSSFKCLLNVFDKDEKLKSLKNKLADPLNQCTIALEVKRLLPNSVEGYEHPNDMAIAAYLWVLEATNKGLALFVANETGLGYKLFWADKMATKIYEGN